MSIHERVRAIRDSLKAAQTKSAQEASEAEAKRIETERRLREQNVASFEKFVRKMKLKGMLQELAEKEKLRNAVILVFPRNPTASIVELSLKWDGRPERRLPENSLQGGPDEGFTSISLSRKNIPGTSLEGDWIVIEGEKEVARFPEAVLNKDHRGSKERLEESLAMAYLKPKWNPQRYVVT